MYVHVFTLTYSRTTVNKRMSEIKERHINMSPLCVAYVCCTHSMHIIMRTLEALNRHSDQHVSV